MIDLYLNTRPDELFHLSNGPPSVVSHFDWGWLRRTRWDCNPGKFISWWFFGHLQWYHGTAKIDGTRTYMAWNGQLGEPRASQDQYVLTTTPSELLAFRWRTDKPKPPFWNDQGGT